MSLGDICSRNLLLSERTLTFSLILKQMSAKILHIIYLAKPASYTLFLKTEKRRNLLMEFGANSNLLVN